MDSGTRIQPSCRTIYELRTRPKLHCHLMPNVYAVQALAAFQKAAPLPMCLAENG